MDETPLTDYPRGMPLPEVEYLEKAWLACREADRAFFTWVGAWAMFLGMVVLTMMGVTSAPGLMLIVYLFYGAFVYGAVKSSWLVASTINYSRPLASLVAFLVALVPLGAIVIYIVQRRAISQMFRERELDFGYLGPNTAKLREMIRNNRSASEV